MVIISTLFCCAFLKEAEFVIKELISSHITPRELVNFYFSGKGADI